MPVVVETHGFAAKWLEAFPELPIALHFIDKRERDARLALDCIGREIELAALRIVDTGVATRKLEWWLDEIIGAVAGRARHPLTQAPGFAKAASRVAASAWRDIITAALALREQTPASTLDDLLEGPRRLHRPLAEIVRIAFDDDGAGDAAEARSLASAFRDALGLVEALGVGRLPLPLDLLARHRLARGDLTSRGAERDASLREHLASLAQRMATIDARRLRALEAASLHAEHWRCRRASRQSAPMSQRLDGMPITTVWVAWRASRARRPRGSLP